MMRLPDERCGDILDKLGRDVTTSATASGQINGLIGQLMVADVQTDSVAIRHYGNRYGKPLVKTANSGIRDAGRQPRQFARDGNLVGKTGITKQIRYVGKYGSQSDNHNRHIRRYGNCMPACRYGKTIKRIQWSDSCVGGRYRIYSLDAALIQEYSGKRPPIAKAPVVGVECEGLNRRREFTRGSRNDPESALLPEESCPTGTPASPEP
jgi:hypothetical protein